MIVLLAFGHVLWGLAIDNTPYVVIAWLLALAGALLGVRASYNR